MSNLGELIEFVRHQLSGLDSSGDAVSALAAPVDTADTSISIDEADIRSGASPGVAEVDFELVRVKSVDVSTATLLLYPFGRGYRGTAAASHSPGAEVRFNPAWPASTIAREINGVLTEIYPTVYAVKSAVTTVQNGPLAVPAEATGVISVWVERAGEPDEWIREDRWDYNPDSTTTGEGLRIGGHHNVGTRVRVVYAARPSLFDLAGSLTQDFDTATGLDPRVSDLLALGVSKRLAPFLDVAKLPFVVAEGNTEGRAPGVGAAAARLLHQLFQARLEQEASILTKEHPIRVHRTR